MSNQLLAPGTTTPIDIGPPKYSSREAKGVWPKPGSTTALWKIYSNQSSFTNAFNTITTADIEGLPVASPFSAIRGYKFRESPTARWTDVYILQTAVLTGTFFAMSQAGQKHVWKQWLDGLDLVKDSVVLNRCASTSYSELSWRVSIV